MSHLSKPASVSILIAARNEETNIIRCLQSLEVLHFPKENMEIWIGDDDSSDQTTRLVQDFIRDKPYFYYHKVSGHTGGLKGKANVLAQLAKKCGGRYLFFCDADIAVPPGWINAMLSYFKENTGVVVGLTRMKKSHALADFLSLEWLFTLTLMRFFSLFNIGISGLGNNMAVTRTAYCAVGGYEGIGFSIVEDHALFMAIIKKKYAFVQTYTSGVIALSEPLNAVGALMIQRKRWMQGIMQSPLVLRIGLYISAFLIPAMAILSAWQPRLSIDMIVSNYLFITAIAVLALLFLKQKDLWRTVFLFWFYLIGISMLMLVIHFLPGKTLWKGRTY